MYSKTSQLSDEHNQWLAKTTLADFYEAIKKSYNKNIHFFDDAWVKESQNKYREHFRALLSSMDSTKDSPEEILVAVYDFYAAQSSKSDRVLKLIRDTLMERVGIKNKLGLYFTYARADSVEEADAQLRKYMFDLKVELGYPVKDGRIDNRYVMMRRR